MFSISSRGGFEKTEAWLKKMHDQKMFDALARYGDIGVSALASATPFETGETSRGWSYEIKRDSGSWSIIWSNSHVEAGRPIAILLQYGHGTGTGGYVEGRDFINPALRPIFDQITSEAWKAVTS